MKRTIDWNRIALVLSATILAAYGHGLADAAFRLKQAPFGDHHWWGVWGLYTCVGALVGMVLCVLTGLEPWATAWLKRRTGSRRAAVWIAPAYYGVVAAALSYGTARWTFSGKAISETIWGAPGPPAFVLLTGAGVMLAARWVIWLVASPGWTKAYAASVLAALFGSTGLVLIDQYAFVSLYEQLHAYLEWSALLLLALAWGLVLHASRRRIWRRVWRGLAVGSCTFAGATVANSSLRDSIDDALTHAWVDPLYVGRMLRRAEELETYLMDPLGYEGIQMGRIARLVTRYGLQDVKLAEKWLNPTAPLEWAEIRKKLDKRGLSNANVLVFYVDTLRYDVAHDPSIMPNLARFSRRSLDFRRAYATGSDTLRSLPGITGGNYFVRHTHATDLSALARDSTHESSLFIAKSAREFLGRLRPSFNFEHEVEVADYDTGREVWGYGADLPTSAEIVDKALEYLKRRKNQKFFMWLFHFDQHNWRELNDAYMAEVKERYEVPEEGAWNSRYRAIATAIDAQFGRLLKGLDDLGLSDDTIVVMLSDHGEGLGEGGFWVHSVFLWESLVRVPLFIRVPGLKGKPINDVVSMVDVAPTIARFLDPEPATHAYHGEDLLHHVEPVVPERRYPVLFSAALRDELVRIGMIDKSGSHKLVLRLEAAQVELHDLRRQVPDDTNVASEHIALSKQMLEDLAHSPIFPRNLEDFRMLNPKGELVFPGQTIGELPASAAHQH